MNIKIVTFEKHKEEALRQLELEYLKRLSKLCKVTLQPLKRKKIRDEKEREIILKEEASVMEEKLTGQEVLVVLDAAGTSLNSKQLASQFRAWQQAGTSSLVFYIGGPLGIASSLKKKADFVLSLSSLTFTHEMARMLLCEAIYRSFDILNHGNYHK